MENPRVERTRVGRKLADGSVTGHPSGSGTFDSGLDLNSEIHKRCSGKDRNTGSEGSSQEDRQSGKDKKWKIRTKRIARVVPEKMKQHKHAKQSSSSEKLRRWRNSRQSTAAFKPVGVTHMATTGVLYLCRIIV